MRYIDRIYFRDNIEEDSYLNSIPAIKSLYQSGGLLFSSDVTFFVGGNGSGKSTLLDGIADRMGLNLKGEVKILFFQRVKKALIWGNTWLFRKKIILKTAFILKRRVFSMQQLT